MKSSVSYKRVKVESSSDDSQAAQEDIEERISCGSSSPETEDSNNNEILNSNTSIVEDSNGTVYYIFYLLGLVTLLPWNFFISINAFWDYKFRNVSTSGGSNGTESILYQDLTSSHLVFDYGDVVKKQNETTRTELQDDFTSYLAIASNTPSATFVILNALYGQHFKLANRIHTSLSTIISMFVVLLILSRLNSDVWQTTFLHSTLAIVVLINCMTAVFQGAVFGVAGRFPHSYIGSVMAGQAVGGIFPSVVDILFQIVGMNPVSVGMISFAIVISSLSCAWLAFAHATKLSFFQHYAYSSSSLRTLASSRDDSNLISDNTFVPGEGGSHSETTLCGDISEDEQHRNDYEILAHTNNTLTDHQKSDSVLLNYIGLLKETWKFQIGVFLTFATTLSVFPAIIVLIRPNDSSSYFNLAANDWIVRLFTPITCFLLFNSGDFLGRIISTRQAQRSSNSPGDGTSWRNSFSVGSSRYQNTLLTVILLRAVIFIPFFMFCNGDPSRRSLPVYVTSDIVYVTVMLLFSVSNGYLANVCMLHGPKVVSNPDSQEEVAMILVASLVIGTCFGSILSYPLISIL